MSEENPIEEQKLFPDDYLHYDKEDALHVILSTPQQIKEGYALGKDIKIAKPFSKILFIGMGGSGIAGALIKELLDADKECKMEILTARGYEAPKEIDSNTLVIAISYSGNTEETVSTYKTAVRKGASALLLSNGGKLEELAKIHKHPHIKVPKGLQPRMAIGYLFFPILRALENTGIIESFEKEVMSLSDTLSRKDVRAQAIELSAKCFEKIPLILSDSMFYQVAYRWKTQFNENSKTPSYSHEFSEFNHNEILGFSNRTAPFHAIILSIDKQHRRISKRIGLTKDILQKKGVSVTEIALKGTLLKEMFTAIFLGDLTSYYLALRYETNPTPVELIEIFKKDLGPFLI